MRPFVLVIEDDAILGETMCEALQGEGYSTHLAKDGEDALGALAELEIPSLVVLDLVLPRFDGWNLLAVLRGLAPIPILVTSGLPEKDRDLARGATAFLAKPFELEDFLRHVRSLCPPRPSKASAPPMVH